MTSNMYTHMYGQRKACNHPYLFNGAETSEETDLEEMIEASGKLHVRLPFPFVCRSFLPCLKQSQPYPHVFSILWSFISNRTDPGSLLLLPLLIDPNLHPPNSTTTDAGPAPPQAQGGRPPRGHFLAVDAPPRFVGFVGWIGCNGLFGRLVGLW